MTEEQPKKSEKREEKKTTGPGKPVDKKPAVHRKTGDRRPNRYSRRAQPEDVWKPKTSIGNKVLSKEMTDIDQILSQ